MDGVIGSSVWVPAPTFRPEGRQEAGPAARTEPRFAGSLLTPASGSRVSCLVLFLVRTLRGSDDDDEAGNRFLLKIEQSGEAQTSQELSQNIKNAT